MDGPNPRRGVKKDDPTFRAELVSHGEAMAQKSAEVNRWTNPLKGPLPRLDSFMGAINTLAADIYKKEYVLKNIDQVAASYSNVDYNSPTAQHVRGLVLKTHATNLFKVGKISEARDYWISAIREMMGKDVSYELPRRTASNPDIGKVHPEAFKDIINCVSNVAQCYVKEDNLVLALEWLEELHAMYPAYTETKDKVYWWKDPYLNYEEYVEARVKAWVRQSLVLSKIGNTALAYSCVVYASKYGWQILPDEDPTHFSAPVRKIQEEAKGIMVPASLKRHPDPSDIGTIQIIEPELQVRGVWKKHKTSGKDVPPSRRGFASVLYNGSYYVFGGQHGTWAFHEDGWAINLRDVQRGWRKIEPAPLDHYGQPLHFHRLTLHQRTAKAYMFRGSLNLTVFDLKTETWSRVQTTTKNRRPWKDFCPHNTLVRYSAEIHQGMDKLFVFGGGDDFKALCRNILMCLDLKTMEWELLSGTMEPELGYQLPGPRGHAGCWLVKDQLYFSTGSAIRTGALQENMPHGSNTDWHYRDLWSWDIIKCAWTHEKMNGSSPSIRTEVAYTFNPTWNRAVVHGGYSTMPFVFRLENADYDELLHYSYLGDTLCWSPESKRWSQVITRGYPCYRASADLVSDPETGRTFMFGGYNNPHHKRAKIAAMAFETFNDLWELCLDVPGSDFKESDFEVDPKFSKLGPWRKCFKCGSVGRWMVCAGSCRTTNASAAFCGTECMKAGWKEHRAQNGCKKI